MSRNFSFKGAWLCNPFSASPVAGRAPVLQEVLIVLGSVGLDREGGFTGLLPGAEGILLALHPSLCALLAAWRGTLALTITCSGTAQV